MKKRLITFYCGSIRLIITPKALHWPISVRVSLYFHCTALILVLPSSSRRIAPASIPTIAVIASIVLIDDLVAVSAYCENDLAKAYASQSINAVQQ